MSTLVMEKKHTVSVPNYFTVKTAWDDESNMWIAVCDDIPLATSSDSYESLIERVKSIADEIIELNYGLSTPANLTFTKALLTADGFV